jgi:AcrR family transcriptional regulator
MADARDRILEATYACITRYGIGKTTVDDAAREARMSRATVYRYFPGGKEQLMAEVIHWEVQRFFLRLAEAVAGASTFAELLEEGLLFAHRAVEDHAVLQKVLQTEPERFLPQLTVESQRLVEPVAVFVQPYLRSEDLRPGVTPRDAAQYVARMILSYINAQGGWDLSDREQVRELVRLEFLSGLVAGGAGADVTPDT